MDTYLKPLLWWAPLSKDPGCRIGQAPLALSFCMGAMFH